MTESTFQTGIYALIVNDLLPRIRGLNQNKLNWILSAKIPEEFACKSQIKFSGNAFKSMYSYE